MFFVLGTMCGSLAAMDSSELIDALSQLEITKGDLARLTEVTVRAVNMWLSGEREIPGPLEAYVRLLRALPKAVLAQELARIREEDPRMYEGMYELHFGGEGGTGSGILVLQGGVIFGHDSGVRYDGTYAPSRTQRGHIDARLCLTVFPGTELVQGIPAQPVQYTFDVECSVATRSETAQTVETPYGPVKVAFRYLRDVPGPWAA